MKLKIKKTMKRSRSMRTRTVQKQRAPTQVEFQFGQGKSTEFMESVKKYITGEIPSEERFVTCDGRQLRSIFELVDALDSMSDDAYYYHVNEERNDFSAWIEGSLQEPKLAAAIRDITSRVEMQIVLLKFLATRFK